MQPVFVRDRLLEPQSPPKLKASAYLWLRANLFASPWQALTTLLLLGLIAALGSGAYNWALGQAVWSGQDRMACLTTAQGGTLPAQWRGACWAFVKANWSQFIYGRYPAELRWRVDLMAVITLLATVPLLVPKLGFKLANALVCVFLVPLLGYILLYGGHFGLAVVKTPLWGGLMLTFIIAYVGILISLLLGTLLALGRRSNLVLIKLLSVLYIEILRGIPLVAMLFVANIMFPLFLPADMEVDKLLRAMVGVGLFAAAYVAEVIRGGLQALPQGQYDAARSMGLGAFNMHAFIILPQAYSLIIPSLISVLIGMFKDTSLVYIISMFDFLGIVRQAVLQAQWSTPQTPITGMVFVALVFWVVCFGMSRYAHYLENYLNRNKNKSETRHD